MAQSFARNSCDRSARRSSLTSLPQAGSSKSSVWLRSRNSEYLQRLALIRLLIFRVAARSPWLGGRTSWVPRPAGQEKMTIHEGQAELLPNRLQQSSYRPLLSKRYTVRGWSKWRCAPRRPLFFIGLPAWSGRFNFPNRSKSWKYGFVTFQFSKVRRRRNLWAPERQRALAADQSAHQGAA